MTSVTQHTNQGLLSSQRIPSPSRIAIFLVTAIALVYYALRGGSYDIIPRQQEALVLWALIGLGALFGLLPGARPPRRALVPFAALCALAIWCAVGLIWTQSQERTFAELARYLHYAGLLLLIGSIVHTRNWRAAAAGLAVGAVVVSALALASRLDPAAFPTNYIGTNLNIDRLSYPFNYWNAVGAWSVMALGSALIWSAHARFWWLRALALAVVPVVAAAAYLSYSRAAVIGAALTILLALWLSRNRWVLFVHLVAAAAGSALAVLAIRSETQIANATGGGGAGRVVLALVGGAAIAVLATAITWISRGDIRWRSPQRATRIAVTVAVLVVVIAVPTAGHGAITRGWHEFHQTPTVPNTSDPTARLTNLNGTRYIVWRSSVKAFEHRPVLGVGAGAFEFWWNYTGGKEFVRDAHSLYLEPFAEEGIPGGVLTIVLIAGLALAALLARRDLDDRDLGAHAALVVPFLAYIFHAGVDWMWESTAVSILGLSLAAVAICAGGRPIERRMSFARVRLPIAVAAAVIALLQLPGLVSTSSTRASQRKVDHGQLPAALSDATRAVNAEPWAATPYTQRALVEEAMNRFAAAQIDLDRAARREPTNYRIPLLLARVDAEAGDVRHALAAYRRAKALRPASIFFAR